MSTAHHTTTTMPVYLVRGRATVISFPLYDTDGDLAAPDAGDTVSVLRPDGTALVDAQTITVTGSIATYTVTPTASEDLGEGWQVVWNLTAGSEAQIAYKQDAAVVRQALYCTVTNGDLLTEHPELVDLYPSGATSWMPQILAAFDDVQRWLLQNGKRPYLVLSPHALHEATRCQALAKVFRSCSTYTVDSARYSELAAEYARAAKEAWGNVSLTYDFDGDGDPDTDEQATGAEPVLFLSDTPAWWVD